MTRACAQHSQGTLNFFMNIKNSINFYFNLIKRSYPSLGVESCCGDRGKEGVKKDEKMEKSCLKAHFYLFTAFHFFYKNVNIVH